MHLEKLTYRSRFYQVLRFYSGRKPGLFTAKCYSITYSTVSYSTVQYAPLAPTKEFTSSYTTSHLEFSKVEIPAQDIRHSPSPSFLSKLYNSTFTVLKQFYIITIVFFIFYFYHLSHRRAICSFILVFGIKNLGLSFAITLVMKNI